MRDLRKRGYSSLTAFLTLFVFFSCSQNSKVKTIPEKDFLPLVEDSVVVQELFRMPKDSVTGVMVMDKAIIQFFHDQNKSDYILQISDLEQKQSVPFIRFGQQPDQLLMPFISRGQGLVMLRDPLLKRVVWIDPGLVLSDTTFSPLLCKSNILSQAEIPCGNRILFLNPYSYPDGRESRVLRSTRRWNYHWIRRRQFSAINCLYGKLVYGAQAGRIAYLAEYEPKLEIMDARGKLLCRIIIKDHLSATIQGVKHGGITEYVYTEDTLPYCFKAADGNERLLAAGYCSCSGEDWILLMDWTGKVKKSFRAVSCIKQISLSGDSSVVYSWETDGSSDRLFVYSLHE